MKLESSSNLFLALVLVPFFVACGGGGGGSSSGGSADVPVVGTDVTGSYRAVGVECYNSSATVLKAVATVDSGYTETLTISKNSYEGYSNSTGCSSRETGRIVYDSTAYTVSISNRKTTTASFSTCSHTMNLTASLGTISPTGITAAVNHNATEPDRTFSAFKNTSNGAIGLVTFIQVVGSPSDICFMIYQQI
jgi:hypothetical protein